MIDLPFGYRLIKSEAALQNERSVETRAGFRNPRTGIGGPTDKSVGGFFVPTKIQSRKDLEVLYVESWATRKFIDIPIEDMLIRWRSFTGKDQEVGAMRNAELRHKVSDRLSQAMRAGRLFGSAFLVMVTSEAPLVEPLNVDSLVPGDLKNLIVFDRFDAEVAARDNDPFSPTFGEVSIYRFKYGDTEKIEVDASRVLRFDGLTPLSVAKWDAYDREWGVPEIVPVLLSIEQDVAMAANVGHLSAVASTGVIRMQGFKDVLSGRGGIDEISPETYGENIAYTLANTRYLFLDKEDEFIRVGVNFSGLPELMDRYARRLAAAADIPATRFWGQSPIGLNATGESDMRNYALRVAAMQKASLTGPLSRLDAVLVKDAAIPEPLPYEFHSLLDLSEIELAQVAEVTSRAVGAELIAGLIDENEGRSILDGDAVFGSLEDLS